MNEDMTNAKPLLSRPGGHVQWKGSIETWVCVITHVSKPYNYLMPCVWV